MAVQIHRPGELRAAQMYPRRAEPSAPRRRIVSAHMRSDGDRTESTPSSTRAQLATRHRFSISCSVLAGVRHRSIRSKAVLPSRRWAYNRHPSTVGAIRPRYRLVARPGHFINMYLWVCQVCISLFRSYLCDFQYQSRGARASRSAPATPCRSTKARIKRETCVPAMRKVEGTSERSARLAVVRRCQSSLSSLSSHLGVLVVTIITTKNVPIICSICRARTVRTGWRPLFPARLLHAPARKFADIE